MLPVKRHEQLIFSILHHREQKVYRYVSALTSKVKVINSLIQVAQLNFLKHGVSEVVAKTYWLDERTSTIVRKDLTSKEKAVFNLQCKFCDLEYIKRINYCNSAPRTTQILISNDKEVQTIQEM